MSELRADTITASNGTGPVTLTKQTAAKAFVSYNASDHIEDDSFNISSLTDGTNLGETDVTFTNNMSNSDHITQCQCLEDSNRIYRIQTRSDSGYTSQSANTSGTGKDDVQGHVTFGDLA